MPSCIDARSSKLFIISLRESNALIGMRRKEETIVRAIIVPIGSREEEERKKGPRTAAPASSYWLLISVCLLHMLYHNTAQPELKRTAKVYSNEQTKGGEGILLQIE